MSSTKGKENLDVATDEAMEATSSGTSVSQLLSTPEPFDINAIADVNQEIERLEALAADHHWLNTNNRFLTRFGRLTSQKEKLEQESIGEHFPDFMDALEASLDQIINMPTPSLSMSTTSTVRESSNESVEEGHPGPSQKQPVSRKKRTQLPRTATMQHYANPATKILSEDDILQIAAQPPAFRSKYSHYWNAKGKIREKYFSVIFQEKDGALILPELVIASNVERWQIRYRQFKHPELLNCRGSLRRRAIKVRMDQRDPSGHYIENEVDEMNRSTRQRVVSAAFHGESLLGAQTRTLPTVSLTPLEKAQAEAVRLQALVHESDACYREEVLKMEKEYKRILKKKELQIDILNQQIAALEKENEHLQGTAVTRQTRVIDRLTTQGEQSTAQHVHLIARSVLLTTEDEFVSAPSTPTL